MSPAPAPSGDAHTVRTTRRRVVRLGAKLAYAAPVVAATMRLMDGPAQAKVQTCDQRGKIGICHRDGQSGNYAFVCVSDNATKGGHAHHAGDIIGVVAADQCPNVSVAPLDLMRSPWP